MYRKITIALIIAVFSLLVAYGAFTGSTAQAAPCLADSTVLAANPELAVTCNYATAENEANLQRANEAIAARYNGLAAFYMTENETNLQRADQANAARYNGLAAFYTTENEVNLQRADQANAARYNGLAAFYTAEN